MCIEDNNKCELIDNDIKESFHNNRCYADNDNAIDNVVSNDDDENSDKKQLVVLSSPNPLIEIETDYNGNVLFEDQQKSKITRFVESSLPKITRKGK